jgi:glycosyltransferase involved in cell wall biosynthesis
MQPYKLSICIPTYNRADFLEESLSAIAIALSTCSDSNRIEVVILDNDSKDHTQKLVQNFIDKKHIDIKYFKNESNIGWKNVIKVIDYALGDYVWIVSDDDLVTKDSISNIVNFLNKDIKISALIVNLASFEKSILDISKPFFRSEKVTSANEGLSVLGRHITFISSVVFKRDITVWNYENYQYESGFCHSYTFLRKMKGGTVAFLSPISLLIRRSNSGGYNFYLFFVSMADEILEYAKNLNYNNDSISKVRSHLARLLYWSSFAIFANQNTKFTLDILDAKKRVLSSHHTKINKLLIISSLHFFNSFPFVAKFAFRTMNFLRKTLSMN